jgi:outer membrane lipoprotein
MKRYILISLLFLLLHSCAHVISTENLQTSITDMPFSEVLKHRDANLNKQFIFGGVIAETVNTREDASIEVVQAPLDRWGNVADRDKSEGRFIVTTKQNLDPLIYRAGRELTISGILVGSQRKTLGGMEYDYPVFAARELQLRSDVVYHPYPMWGDPFYYPYPYYWYGPSFWYRPHWYPY